MNYCNNNQWSIIRALVIIFLRVYGWYKQREMNINTYILSKKDKFLESFNGKCKSNNITTIYSLNVKLQRVVWPVGVGVEFAAAQQAKGITIYPWGTKL